MHLNKVDGDIFDDDDYTLAQREISCWNTYEQDFFYIILPSCVSRFIQISTSGELPRYRMVSQPIFLK